MTSLTLILILSITLPFINYNTRQCNKLHLPAPKTNWGKQKLTYQASKDFNNLNPEIQGTESILLFKKESAAFIVVFC